MTPTEIRAQWLKRRLEVDAARLPKTKGKGKEEPSPWVKWGDFVDACDQIDILCQSMESQEELLQEIAAQLGEVNDKHKKEIEKLRDEHARDLQKKMRGL